MPRNRNATSRVKNSKKKAADDLRVQTSRRKVKMNQPCPPRCQSRGRCVERGARRLTIRYMPNESRKVLLPYSSRPAMMLKPPGVNMMAVEIQKPP